MHNYVLMRISCLSVFKFCFCAGTCLAGAGGILLGLLEQSTVGILGGAFLGLVTGLLSGIFGAVYAAVFNLLAPIAGGIAMRLEPLPEAKDTAGSIISSPGSPADLPVSAPPSLNTNRDLQPPS